MKRSFLFLLSLLPCSLLSAGAPAPVPTTPAPEVSTIELRAGSSYVFESDFDGDDTGGTESIEARARLTWKYLLTENWRFSLGAGYARFDFPGASGPIPDALQQVTGEIGIEYLVRGRPAFFLSSRPGFYYTDQVNADAFDAPVVLAIAFPVSKQLILSVGAIYSRFRETPVLPIAGLIWDINDNLTLNLIAPEPALTYRCESGTEISLKGELTGTSVHAGDDLPEPYAGDNLDYLDLRAGLGVRFGGKANWTASFDAGWSFMRKFEYDDRGEDFKQEGAPYVKVRFDYTF